MDSSHKGPVAPKMFPFDDIIMMYVWVYDHDDVITKSFICPSRWTYKRFGDRIICIDVKFIFRKRSRLFHVGRRDWETIYPLNIWQSELQVTDDSLHFHLKMSLPNTRAGGGTHMCCPPPISGVGQNYQKWRR